MMRLYEVLGEADRRQPALTGGVASARRRAGAPAVSAPAGEARRLICLLLVGGMLGFAVAEDTSLWIGFVWTLDTIATVGSIPVSRDDGRTGRSRSC